MVSNFNNTFVVRDYDVFFRHTKFNCKFFMELQAIVVSVYGDKEFRMNFSVKPLYVFLVAMPSSMNVIFTRGAVADNFNSLPGQAVFHSLYRALIAGDNRGRKNNSIALF